MAGILPIPGVVSLNKDELTILVYVRNDNQDVCPPRYSAL